ncbi:MAG: hypothetical protein U1E65_25555 [Myxococcota bacterium]
MLLASLLWLALVGEAPLPELYVHAPPGRPCAEEVSELLRGKVLVAPLFPASMPTSTVDFDALRIWAKAERTMHKGAALLVVDGSDKSLRWHLYWGDGHEALRVLGPAHGCQLTRRGEVQARRWVLDHLSETGPAMAQRDPRPSSPPSPSPSPPHPEPTPSPSPSPSPPPVATSTRTATNSGALADAPPPAAEGPETQRRPRFEVAAGLDLVSHTFRYNDPVTPNTKELRYDLVPIPRITARVRPLSGDWARLALSGSLRQSIGLDAAPVSGGDHVSLSAFDLDLRLSYDFEVNASDRPITVQPLLGFHHASTALGSAAEVPSVAVSSGVAGVGALIPVKGRISISGAASYLLTLSTGGNLASDSFFPGPTIHGLDLVAMLHLSIGQSFEARFAVDYLQYFMSFTKKDGAVRVASGARDETISVTALFAFRLD